MLLHSRNEESIPTESIPVVDESGTFATSLSSDLSSYVGGVIVGYAVDRTYLNAALNTIKDYVSDETAVYIFYAGADREDNLYVSITVYDAIHVTFTDLDLDMVSNEKSCDISYTYESRDNLINTRK